MTMQISVVMPNRNMAVTLGDAVDGVCRQTLAPAEFVVLDDASTDESVSVIKRRMAEHKFLSVVERQQRSDDWLLSMLRFGAEQTDSDWLHFPAADDAITAGDFYDVADSHRGSAGVVIAESWATDTSGGMWRTRCGMRLGQATHNSLERQLTSINEPFCCGGPCALFSRRALDWLMELGVWHTQGWMDFIGTILAGFKFGAAFVPHPCGLTRLVDDGWGSQMLRTTERLLPAFDAVLAVIRKPQVSSIMSDGAKTAMLHRMLTPIPWHREMLASRAGEFTDELCRLTKERAA